MEDNKVTIKNNRMFTTNAGLALQQRPKLEDMKVIIWDKELCNGAEWNDFLKAVEEKSQENKQLKEQLAIREKALEISIDKYIKIYYCMSYNHIDYDRIHKNLYDDIIEQAKESVNEEIDNKGN